MLGFGEEIGQFSAVNPRLPFVPPGKAFLPALLELGRELLKKGDRFGRQHGFVSVGNRRRDLNLNHWACH
jgi:hypothetical protein